MQAVLSEYFLAIRYFSFIFENFCKICVFMLHFCFLQTEKSREGNAFPGGKIFRYRPKTFSATNTTAMTITV